MLNRLHCFFFSPSKALLINIEANPLFLPKCLQGLDYLSSCICRISASCHSPVEGVGYFAISLGMAINSRLLTVIVLIDRAFESAPVIYGDIPCAPRAHSSPLSTVWPPGPIFLIHAIIYSV